MRDGRPWGLNGPEFLPVYAVALAVVCGVVVFARGVARGREFRNDEHVELTACERAYLNGGADRVADTALAGLIESWGVRISSRRDLAVIKPRKARDEHQKFVVDQIDNAGASTVARVRRAVRRKGSCAPLVRSLRERGLIASARMERVVRAARALIPALVAIGVVRAVNGIAQGYPVGFLVMELFATGLVWSWFQQSCRPPLLTWRGEAVRLGDPVPEDREDERGQHRRYRKFDRRDADSAKQNAAAEVAVGGLRRYPDAATARLLAPPRSSGGGTGAGGFAGGGGGGGGGCGGGGA
jgi:uncharacterized protein (TIGR04222 family)